MFDAGFLTKQDVEKIFPAYFAPLQETPFDADLSGSGYCDYTTGLLAGAHRK